MNKRFAYLLSFIAVCICLCAAFTAGHTSESPEADGEEAEESYITIDLDLSDSLPGYPLVGTGEICFHEVCRYIETTALPGSIFLYRDGAREKHSGLVFYDKDGNYISGTLGKSSCQTIPVPENAAICRAGFRTDKVHEISVMIRTEDFSRYAIAYANLKAKQSGDRPYFVLPRKTAGIAGRQWNLYFDNVVSGLTEEYDILCSISPALPEGCVKQYRRLLQITPPTAGTYTITLNLVESGSGKGIDERQMSFHVMENRLDDPVNVMFLGDSLTNAGIFAAEISCRLNRNIHSVGTVETACMTDGQLYTVWHEGRSGWSAMDYVSVASRDGVENAFWDSEKQCFSFSYYMQNNQEQAPAVVCIGLGTNGAEHITEQVQAVREIVDSIHAYDSRTVCLVSLIAPPASQDGTGYKKGLQSSKEMKRAFLKLNHAYLDEFQDRENTDVYELYFNLDSENDFDTVEIPLSDRNPNTWICQNNNVHPNEYGYLKFADVIYANLLYHLQ